MIKDNMKMIKGMKNRYDYNEYVTLCREYEKPIRPLGQYLQGISVLEYGLLKYGGDWQEAYLKAFADINKPGLPEADCCANEVTKEKVEPLGLKDTVKNFVQSTGQHIKHGLKNVSKEEAFRRLSICMKCDELKDNFQCDLCHCYMGIKATWDIENICKSNKW